MDENPYWKYKLAIFIAPNGKEQQYYFADTTGGVVIIGVRDDGRIPLVRQYRPLHEKVSLEFPAGRIDDRDAGDHASAAAREFAEEAKYKAETWKLVGVHEPMAGTASDKIFVYVATGLRSEVSEQDAVEEFEEITMSPEEIDQAIVKQEITNGIIIAAWCQARPHVVDFLA